MPISSSTWHPGVDATDAVRAIAGLREPRTTIGGVNLVTGFRPELWARVAPDAMPADVHGFNEPMVGKDGYTLPATQRDVVFWLTGAAYDLLFDFSRSIAMSLASIASARARGRWLALSPRPGPDRLHRRHGEPDALSKRCPSL